MTQRSRARTLSADEERLWTSITRVIKPLKPKPVVSPAVPSAPSDRAPAGPLDVPKAPVPEPLKKGPPVPTLLDRRLRQRIARGHEPISRRLDLHGLTQHQAHTALAAFLRSAQADGLKVVLVVTGKGARDGRDPRSARDPFAERGVLRRLVPQWLRTPELRHLVVGFDAAHIGHGGEGALYVRLRRRRD